MKVLPSIMSITSLIGCVEKALPDDAARRELLLYYLIPVLNRAAKSDLDRKMINELVLRVA
ncbi:protein of unknown function [Pseudomonas mediterranea]